MDQKTVLILKNTSQMLESLLKAEVELGTVHKCLLGADANEKSSPNCFGSLLSDLKKCQAPIKFLGQPPKSTM